MSVAMSVEEYIARQPQFAWRRSLLRGVIRVIVLNGLARVTVTGSEHIPDEGPGIVMVNHTSLLDPVIGMGAVMNRYVVPMGKAELLGNPVIAFFIRFWGAYVVKRDQIDRKALTNSIELLKSGQLLLLAPEGTRQRNGLARPKDGFTYMAAKTNAAIVPAAISGGIDWEKKLTRGQRPHLHLNFGRAFRFKTDGRTRIPREELTAMSDEAMYQLSFALTDESLRGVYSDLSQASTNYLEFLSEAI